MESSCKQTLSYQNKIIKWIESQEEARPQLFTPWEVEVIRKYYPTKGSVILAKALKKTPRQIIGKAGELNLKRSAK